jgi:hypothetical protein
MADNGFDPDGTFKQKTVWHSHFKTLSPLVVRFTTRVTPSKYKDKMDLAGFRVQGDGNKYALNIENERIAQKVDAAQVKRWYRVTATGGSEDDPGSADILIEELDSQPETMTAAGGRVKGYPDQLAFVTESLILAMEVTDAVEERMGRKPTMEESSLATAIRISHERTDLPLRESDIVYEPTEDAVDEKSTDDQMAEIRRLMDEAALTDQQRKDVEAWLSTDLKSLELAQMIIQLKERISEKPAIPQLL